MFFTFSSFCFYFVYDFFFLFAFIPSIFHISISALEDKRTTSTMNDTEERGSKTKENGNNLWIDFHLKWIKFSSFLILLYILFHFPKREFSAWSAPPGGRVRVVGGAYQNRLLDERWKMLYEKLITFGFSCVQHIYPCEVSSRIKQTSMRNVSRSVATSIFKSP